MERKSILIHEGYTRISKRRPYYHTPGKDFLSLVLSRDSTVAVKHNKICYQDFGVWAGALKKKDGEVINHVFFPKQLSRALLK